MEGLYDAASLEKLTEFFDDCQCVDFQYDYCIKLSKEIKKKIVSLIENGEILYDIVHQCICKNGLQ